MVNIRIIDIFKSRLILCGAYEVLFFEKKNFDIQVYIYVHSISHVHKVDILINLQYVIFILDFNMISTIIRGHNTHHIILFRDIFPNEALGS